MKNKIGRIGIFMGGPSSEREISLRSGGAVYHALKNQGYDVVLIDILSEEDVHRALEKSGIDTAFIALHGRFGEDGKIQAIFEDYGIAYTGSRVGASRLSIRKSQTKKIFKKHNIPTPDYHVFTAHDNFSMNGLILPVVVKPSREGSSIGMSIVESAEELPKAMEIACQYDDEIIVEKYIKGRELTVGILDEEALPVVEIKPGSKFYDYTAKYTKGMTQYLVPAPLEKPLYNKVQEAGLYAHKAAGCRGFSRVDIMLEDKTGMPYVLEINTIPGLTSTSLLPKAAEAAGIGFGQLCVRLIEASL